MRINGYEVQVDVLREMQELGLKRIRVGQDNIQACCPFHNEENPSFGINRTSGLYNCFGCSAKGDFLTFIERCKKISRLSAFRYLMNKYSHSSFILSPTPGEREEKKEEVHVAKTDEYETLKRLLAVRHIDERMINMFQLSFNLENSQIEMPWFNLEGELVFVQYKDAISKQYTYSSNAPKNNYLYGLNVNRGKRIVLVEGNFDVMYGTQNGLPCVAIGSNLISDKQVEQLLKAGVKLVDIMLDNDRAGRDGTERAKYKLREKFILRQAIYDTDKKDINEMSPAEIERIKWVNV